MSRPLPDYIQVEETARIAAQREYRVRVAESHLDSLVSAKLESLGRSVRMPGFRPGRIPPDVLRLRYGAKTRSDLIQKLANEAASGALPDGALISSVEFACGGESGDLELKIAVTYLPDLPAIDFSQLSFEKLTGEGWTDEQRQLAGGHLNRQVLDALAKAYSFPVAPAVVDMEFTNLWKAAQEQLDPADNAAEVAASMREIAERRVRLGIVVAEIARRNRIAADDQNPLEGRRGALERQVIAWIVTQAQVRERKVTAEDLESLANELDSPP